MKIALDIDLSWIFCRFSEATWCQVGSKNRWKPDANTHEKLDGEQDASWRRPGGVLEVPEAQQDPQEAQQDPTASDRDPAAEPDAGPPALAYRLRL